MSVLLRSRGVFGSFVPYGLHSFGLNNNGRTGLGVDSGRTDFPKRIRGFVNWGKVSAGDAHSLGTHEGELYSWGQNSNGKTGLGTTSGDTLVPTRVGSDVGWTDVAAGSTHSLGVYDGYLYSWGRNLLGSTAQGALDSNTLQPTQVGTLEGWTHVAAGLAHSLGIRNGELYGWGGDDFGRTGLGRTGETDTLVPTRVGSFSDWTHVSAGHFHSLAIRDGKLYSFGKNEFGATGRNTETGNTSTPQQISTFVGWEAVSASPAHSLAIRLGLLHSFGRNLRGATGLEIFSDTNTLVPTQVGSITGWTHVSAGGSNASSGHSLAVSDGVLYAFGDPRLGQTGLVETPPEFGFVVSTPTQVSSFKGWADVSAGGSFSLANLPKE